MADEKKLRLLIAEKLRRRRDERLRYWTPNGGQEKFISEISRAGTWIVINGSGNGGGKTHGIIATLAAVMWPMLAPPAFSAPIFQKWPYPKRARIISTPKEVEEIGSIQATIKELFPIGRYEPIRKGKSYPSQFKSDTGWIVDVMTYEQDEGEFAGPNIGLTIFNEPMPERIWKESVARTRKGGILLVAMTSLWENPWVVDGLLNKADGQKIRVVYCDQEENCIQHGKNGTLQHEQLEKILEQYDQDEREARKSGKPLSLTGAIFKRFDRSVHVLNDEPRPSGPVTRYQVVDPAGGKPLAVLWAYADVTGRVTIYDEWPEYAFVGAKDPNLSLMDYVGIFKAKENGVAIENRILDRHYGNARHTPGARTLKEQFSDLGLDFSDSYHVGESVPEVETGIQRVKDFLTYDKSKPLDGANCPHLYISSTCKNTIAAMERWSRDPRTGKPREEYKDFADLVRYLVMSDPIHEKSVEWGKNRPAYYGVSHV